MSLGFWQKTEAEKLLQGLDIYSLLYLLYISVSTFDGIAKFFVAEEQ